MTKTLGHFLGGAMMLWSVGLLAVPAHAQSQGSVTFYLSSSTGSGPAHQTYPEVLHIYNAGDTDATGVTVTFTPPKGVKVDSSCLVDHMPGGVRSYTCLVGTIPPGTNVDVVLMVSMTKAGDATFSVDVTCDQHANASAILPITFI